MVGIFTPFSAQTRRLPKFSYPKRCKNDHFEIFFQGNRHPLFFWHPFWNIPGNNVTNGNSHKKT